MNNQREEKRYLPRLLCKDVFCGCWLTIDGVNYPANPINYHHRGIALYTLSPLPETQFATLCLSCKKSDERIEIVDLPVKIVHINEMDVGCKYGLSFALDQVTDQTIIENLLSIESVLQALSDTGDRYGLF